MLTRGLMWVKNIVDKERSIQGSLIAIGPLQSYTRMVTWAGLSLTTIQFERLSNLISDMFFSKQ